MASQQYAAGFFALFSTFIAQVAANPAPIVVEWSTSTFGPDGPWQAVTMVIGNASSTPASTVQLYPGGSFDSNVLTTGFCDGSTGGLCQAAGAGLYDIKTSASAVIQHIFFNSSLDQWDGAGAMNITGSASFVFDTFSFQATSAIVEVPNVVFSAVDASVMTLPDGSHYPERVGNLALGAPNLQQVFTLGGGNNITGNLMTGYLRQQNQIHSSSWGLHIGSVQSGQKGSLILGGYDQSRALGNVGVYDNVGAGGEPDIPLVDVTMGVMSGASPFSTANIGSLFHAGGNTSATMVLNPSIPYMYLPFGTCEAIAKLLPVTFQPASGLYIWNTNDPRYLPIVTSPSFLQFTFQQTTATNLTIKVPFALLNLTLDTPIVPTPQAYFPCKPSPIHNDHYALGRAFLQAAYLGMNWEQGKFFLAQAPGPNSGPTQITPIAPSDLTISSNPANSFASTWSGKLKQITGSISSTGGSPGPTGNSISTPSPSPTPNPASEAVVNSSSGLSLGAQIGIGVGIGLIGLLLIAALLAWLFVRRRRRSPIAGPMPVPPVEQKQKALPVMREPFRPTAYEMDAPPIRYEVVGDSPRPMDSKNVGLVR